MYLKLTHTEEENSLESNKYKISTQRDLHPFW